jgi:hypothetical protein
VDSHHEHFQKNGTVPEASDRSFGLVFGALFLLIALKPLMHNGPVRWWALVICLLLLGMAITWPALLHPANRLWLKIGLVIAHVGNAVILSLLFFLVFVPVGLMLRLRRKDPLGLHYDKEVSTYWLDRHPPSPAPKTMKNQF